MKRLLFPLFFLVLSAAAQPAARQLATPTRFSGTVRDADGRPLPGVNVFLKTTFDGASTDSLGRFHFDTGHAAGALPLVVTFIGYEPQEVPVALGAGPIVLPNIRLKASRAALGDVVVTAGAFEASDAKRSAALTPLDIVTTAGALGDVTGALNALPGTTRNPESGQLFVRGGAASETKTYLDGLPVQSPYGGAVPGTVPARGRFSPMLFKGTVFSTGGYSAEYGQALSAVVNLQTADLAPQTETGLSLMSVGGSVSRTQRWARTSLSLDADYVNLTPYFRLVPQQFGWKQAPQSAGGSLSLRHRTGQWGMLKVYGTVGRQRLALRQADANPEYADGRPVALANDNLYLNTTFRAPLRAGWGLNTGLALSRDYNAVRPDVQAVRDVEQSAVARLVLTNDSAATWFNLKLGTELLAQRYRQAYRASPGADVRRLGFDERRAAAFAESEVVLSRRLAGRVGLRGEYSGLLGRANLAPRAALAYQTGGHSQLSAAWGRFYQTPTNDLLRFGAPLGFERAQHLLLTYQRVVGTRTLRAELYRKDYTDLTTYDAANPYRTSAYQNAGSGYAQGLDVFWRDRSTVPRLDYWVSYGYLSTARRFRADPVANVPTFAARHSLSVVAKYWVAKIHTQFGGTYAYTGPRSYQDPNQLGYNQGRTPAYQDLSLNLSYLTHIAGQFTILHVALSNVLGQPQIFGYRYADAPAADGQYGRVAQTPGAPRMLFVGLFISINKKAPGDTSVAPD